MGMTTRYTTNPKMETNSPDHRSRQAPFISCVVPAFNEAANIDQLLATLDQQLRQTGSSYEVIIVDDGSRDGTADAAIRCSENYPVRLIQFSRNFGKEIALSAGIDHADGDVVVLLDADLQHPATVIPEMLQRWRDGYDMVYAVRTDRTGDSRFRQLGTRLFYRLLARMCRIDIPENAGDFRLMDRKVVLALRALPERSRFMKGLYAWVGFNSIGIPYAFDTRAAGESQFGLRKLAALALTGITSFSELPLRVWALIGAIVSILSLLYAAWIVAMTLIFGIDVPGYATISAGLMFFGGVQLFSVGILGEYIGRIFNEVKQRPLYLVTRKHGFRSESTNQGT